MRRAVTWWWLGLTLFCAQDAWAAPKGCPPKPDSDAEARSLAGERFARGEKLFAERKFDAAMAEFLCSLRLAEHENTVLNIAACLKNSNKKKAALEPLRNYVRQHPEAPSSAEMRAVVHSAEDSLGLVRSDLPEPPEPPAEPPAPEPTEEFVEPPPPEAAPTPDEPAPEASPGRLKKVLGWTAIGLGGAALVAGPVLLGVGSSASDSADEATTYAQFEDERDRMHTLRTVGFVSLGVAAGLIGAGLLVLLLPGSAERAEGDATGELELSASLLPNGLALTGRF